MRSTASQSEMTKRDRFRYTEGNVIIGANHPTTDAHLRIFYFKLRDLDHKSSTQLRVGNCQRCCYQYHNKVRDQRLNTNL
ncbi:hypothetical protein EVAR_102380_1 [Eumeta japonica]|uniref:Uncharacterized protein n=1 Tax=Eumeta variegata TaxID=151549 RepID=A0A4C2ADT9_EUMVA|nr:hypothetical protein EVAR_102380_1 [Eumeta japonica]